MPVDRVLAYECLKWIDPKVYKAYIKVRYNDITDEELERDLISYYKLCMITQTLDVVDSLEQKGLIEIFNDYDNERILLRMKKNNTRLDEYGLSV